MVRDGRQNAFMREYGESGACEGILVLVVHIEENTVAFRASRDGGKQADRVTQRFLADRDVIGMDLLAIVAYQGLRHGARKGRALHAITKELAAIHVLLSRSLFGDGILRSLLLRVSLAKSTSAVLQYEWRRRTKPRSGSRQHP